jgi:hypothetical protein
MNNEPNQHQYSSVKQSLDVPSINKENESVTINSKGFNNNNKMNPYKGYIFAFLMSISFTLSNIFIRKGKTAN